MSAFKENDVYVDQHGFQGSKIQPVLNLVVTPARERTDPDRSKVIWDTDAAIDWMESERARFAA